MSRFACDVEPCARGLILAELRRRLPQAGGVEVRDAEVVLELAGSWRPLLGLRLAAAVHHREHHDVTRPRALLGDAAARRTVAALQAVIGLHPPRTFHALRFNAAGANSNVFVRLGNELAQRIGMGYDQADGDLVVRVRPADGGWDVDVRLTPRPLTTRAWRVHDVPGALNACLAAAMVEWTVPTPRDRVLNLLCGTGTLLVERALRAPAPVLLGIDHDRRMVGITRAHLYAAGVAATVLHGDARRLPLAAASVDVVLADLPYGHRMGSHAENDSLYPGLLAEAARVAAPGARAALITHDLRRFERALEEAAPWRLIASYHVTQRGQHPRVFVLERRRTRGSAT